MKKILSPMIQVLKSGFSVIISNAKLLFVIVLIIVFPLIFNYTFNKFVDFARDNQEDFTTTNITKEQDILEFIFKNNSNEKDLISEFLKNNTDLTKLKLVEEKNDNLFIIFDLDENNLNQIEENTKPYKSALLSEGETFIFTIKSENGEQKQAFRYFKSLDGKNYYLFTEHNFSKKDLLLEKRIVDAYLNFSYIFIFLIFLAYWISRQINYEKLYYKNLKLLEEKDLFVNSLAHEFRSPLTAIRGYTDLIEESSEGENKTFSTRIKESTNRLLTLVNDFLDATKVQSGKLQITNENINVGHTVEKIISDMKPLADIKNLKLFFSVPTKDIFLLTDEKRLIQILINLISNAIKYTERGEINVILENNITNLIIKITDTGGGITAEEQKNMFKPFVRFGSNDQQTKISGSGLGMWITKQLIDQLHAEIFVESIQGIGTHITIKFRHNIH